MSWTCTENLTLHCLLCPHHCRIAPGRAGRCKVRQNRDGELVLAYAGVLSSIAVDPIEKKPLYHFHPGQDILSIGFYGCNLHCPFCQNYSISQHVVATSKSATPQEVVGRAIEQRSFGIAYTYSEPLVHFEFVRDTCIEAHRHGLKNVLVTNGFIETEPAIELLREVDAANIDLKAWSDSFYSEELGGSIEPVREFIRTAHRMGVHVEVTTLLIPGKNDSDREIEAIVAFLAEIDIDLVYHLSAYHPAYRYSLPPAETNRVLELVAIAKQRLRFVYPGNTGVDSGDTLCPSCGATAIRRSGYRIDLRGMRGDACAKCGHHFAIPGLRECEP